MTISFVDGAATIGTSEYSLPGNTTTGVPTSQTDDCLLQGWVDVGAMASGDAYQITLYEKVNAGTQRIVDQWTLTDAQAKPAVVIPAVIVGDGWDLTVKKTAGSDRSIRWSLRKIT